MQMRRRQPGIPPNRVAPACCRPGKNGWCSEPLWLRPGDGTCTWPKAAACGRKPAFCCRCRPSHQQPFALPPAPAPISKGGGVLVTQQSAPATAMREWVAGGRRSALGFLMLDHFHLAVQARSSVTRLLAGPVLQPAAAMEAGLTGKCAEAREPRPCKVRSDPGSFESCRHRFGRLAQAAPPACRCRAAAAPPLPTPSATPTRPPGDGPGAQLAPRHPLPQRAGPV